MKSDLLDRIESLIVHQKNKNKNNIITLELTQRELVYLAIWIKTAYENENALNKALGLK